MIEAVGRAIYEMPDHIALGLVFFLYFGVLGWLYYRVKR